MKGLFAAALAIPAAITRATSIGLNRINADFDDIKVTLAGTSLQPIGDYKSLTWDGFNVIDVSAAPVGVAAQSSPNVAVQYLLSEPDLTATLKPSSSKTAYFSLQSFYFGCVASSQETLAGVPTACTLTLTGKKNGKTLVTQKVEFDPGLLDLRDTMQKVEFKGKWANVDSVDFKQTGLLAAATSVLYDDVHYTTFNI